MAIDHEPAADAEERRAGERLDEEQARALPEEEAEILQVAADIAEGEVVGALLDDAIGLGLAEKRAVLATWESQ